MFPTESSENTRTFTNASGDSAPLVGVKEVVFGLQNGTKYRMRLQVLDPLRKTLFSVSELLHSCRIVFDTPENGGSFLEHRESGAQIRIYPKNGIFVVPIWIKKVPSARDGRLATPLQGPAASSAESGTGGVPPPPTE